MSINWFTVQRQNHRHWRTWNTYIWHKRVQRKVRRALPTYLFELVMPIILSNVVEREPMYSSEVFPTLRLSADTRIASETVSSEAAMGFLHFFPSYLVFCNPHPCVVVLQIVSLGFFCILKLEELTDVILTSLSWSSHNSACLVATAETWI